MSEARLEDHETLLLELEAAELEALASAEQEAPDESEEGAKPDEATSPAVRSLDDVRAAALSSSWQDLFELADAEGLVARANALRTGKGLERDLPECFECFQAAAELGHADAKFAVALFHLSGAVVPEDVNAGLGKLRDAAGAGSLRAKIYLGNVYELGVGRAPDLEKADVWYRASARAVAVDHDPDSDEYAKAMAELGCIRHVRLLLKDESIPKKDRYGFLTTAKALGYGLHQRYKERAEREEAAIAREVEEATRAEEGSAQPDTAPTASASDAGRPAPPRTKAAEEEPPKSVVGVPQTTNERLTAFAIAAVFVAAGAGGGLALSAAATELLAAGQPVPLVGDRRWAIMPAAIAASLVPALLVYQLTTLLLSAVAGLVLGVAGWAMWVSGPGRLFADRLMQSQVFGIIGVVVALLIIGLLGGTRRRRWRSSK